MGAGMNLAERYAEWSRPAGRVQEGPSAFSPLRMPREIAPEELQVRWFAGEFGNEFISTAGERVRIVSFGSWNREAGPVFAEAQVSFRGEIPRVGGIEVHTDPLDWDRLSSPDHESTVLHVFAGGGVGGKRRVVRTVTASGREVPQIVLDVTALEFAHDEPLAPDPGPDPGAGAEPQRCGCRAPLAKWLVSDPARVERLEALLEAAAQYRLCRKAARLARLRHLCGASEGLYQALAETLGYRRNKLPFILLAQRFPLSLLRRRIGEIEPMLFAGSSFLSATDLGAMAPDTRGYLRELWDLWWPQRTEFERLTLPASFWTLRGARPVNHPQRRVAALAELVRNWPIIESLAAACEVPAIRAFFGGLRHRYWDTHFTLTSQASPRRMALIGPARVTDMLANVFFPAAVAASPGRWKDYRQLPALDSNQKVDEAVARLFGAEKTAEAGERFLKKAVFQQGILQLFEDHCVDCEGDCDRCALPERLEEWVAARP